MDNILERLRFVLSLVIPLFYVIIGIYVMVEKVFMKKLEPEFAYPLGGVLIVYGLYRLYRAVVSLKKGV